MHVLSVLNNGLWLVRKRDSERELLYTMNFAQRQQGWSEAMDYWMQMGRTSQARQVTP